MIDWLFYGGKKRSQAFEAFEVFSATPDCILLQVLHLCQWHPVDWEYIEQIHMLFSDSRKNTWNSSREDGEILKNVAARTHKAEAGWGPKA